MRRLKTFCTFFFIFLLLAARAQYNADYKLLSSEKLPESYVVNIQEEVKKSVEQQTVLEKKEAEYFFEEIFRIKKDLFESGDVFLPNRLTHFLDTIANSLIEVEPKLKGKVRVYLTKYCSNNAFCLSDGSVFINIGLISKMDNESELAFVIAHELGHVILNHSLNDFSKLLAIKKRETNSADYANTFRSLRFSRESEYEADSYALSLINSAGFPMGMAVQALGKLRDNVQTEEIDFEKIFRNDFFKLDTAFKIKDLAKKTENILRTFSKKEPDSKIDDLYETHPDIDKRISSLQEIQKNLKIIQSRPESNRYNDYKALAMFEMCNLNFCEQDYLNCIINSAKLLKTYPNNTYLLGNISRSLNRICHHKELSTESFKVNGDIRQNTSAFVVLYLLFNQMGLKESKQLSYAFLRSREAQISSTDQLSFYLALSTETYLGMTAAREYYRTYNRNFPTGTYSAFVNNKLK